MPTLKAQSFAPSPVTAFRIKANELKAIEACAKRMKITRTAVILNAIGEYIANNPASTNPTKPTKPTKPTNSKVKS